MDEKHKEVDKIEQLRHRLTELSELIAVGKHAKDYFVKHPVGSTLGVLLVGIFVAVFSGGFIRLIFGLVSFGLRVAAFIFVARQTFQKISGLFTRSKK